VHGDDGTVGAVSAVDKLTTEVTAPVVAGVRERAYELGATLAATLMD
jgi:hypothetical protein